MKIGESIILHGDIQNDSYLVIEENNEILVVHTDYFYQESAVLFQVASSKSDWSEGMLLDSAKRVVDLLNNSKFYPSSSI